MVVDGAHPGEEFDQKWVCGINYQIGCLTYSFRSLLTMVVLSKKWICGPPLQAYQQTGKIACRTSKAEPCPEANRLQCVVDFAFNHFENTFDNRANLNW